MSSPLWSKDFFVTKSDVACEIFWDGKYILPLNLNLYL